MGGVRWLLVMHPALAVPYALSTLCNWILMGSAWPTSATAHPPTSAILLTAPVTAMPVGRLGYPTVLLLPVDHLQRVRSHI